MASKEETSGSDNSFDEIPGSISVTPPPPYKSPSDEELGLGGATGIDRDAIGWTPSESHIQETPPPYTPLYFPAASAALSTHHTIQVSCTVSPDGAPSYFTSCLLPDAPSTFSDKRNPVLTQDGIEYPPLLPPSDKALILPPKYATGIHQNHSKSSDLPDYACANNGNSITRDVSRNSAATYPSNTPNSYSVPSSNQNRQADYGSYNIDELLSDEESVMLRNEFTHCKDWNTGKYLLVSFITCLCCSPIFGCVAIIFSLAAHISADQGDVVEARMRGRIALACCIIGVAISLTCFSLYMTSCCSNACSLY